MPLASNSDVGANFKNGNDIPSNIGVNSALRRKGKGETQVKNHGYCKRCDDQCEREASFLVSPCKNHGYSISQLQDLQNDGGAHTEGILE